MAEPTYSVRVFSFRRVDGALRTSTNTVAQGQSWQAAKRWRQLLCDAAAKRGRPRPHVQLVKEAAQHG